MKQIIKEDDQVKITRKGNRVIKEYSQGREHIDKIWLTHYQNFSKLYGGVVTVHDAGPHQTVMDYVEGKSLKDLLYHDGSQYHIHRKFSYKCFAAMLQSLADMAEYSSTLYTTWFHSDAASHNYIYTGKDFILIDPDSFMLTDNPYPGTFVSSLHPLHSILHAIHSMNRIRYRKKLKENAT